MCDVANYGGHLAFQFGVQPRCKSLLQRIVLVSASFPARLSPAVENGIGKHSDGLDRALSGFGMMDRVIVQHPQIKIVATTLRRCI